MNDYLWDKSGEPDPEIDRLEGLLQPLRYQPPAESLALPEIESPFMQRKTPVVRWALAAAVAFMALALGLWIIRQPSPQTLAVADTGTGTAEELSWTGRDIPVLPTVVPGDAGRTDRVVRPRAKKSALSLQIAAQQRAERHEGQLAAEQLLKALRITSDQLNFVRNKVDQTDAPTPES